MDKILKLLEDDATLTAEQLAVMCEKEVGEIRDLIRRYEKDGVILGYKTLVDWDKTDREYDPFIQVYYLLYVWHRVHGR